MQHCGTEGLPPRFLCTSSVFPIASCLSFGFPMLSITAAVCPFEVAALGHPAVLDPSAWQQCLLLQGASCSLWVCGPVALSNHSAVEGLHLGRMLRAEAAVLTLTCPAEGTSSEPSEPPLRLSLGNTAITHRAVIKWRKNPDPSRFDVPLGDSTKTTMESG